MQRLTISEPILIPATVADRGGVFAEFRGSQRVVLRRTTAPPAPTTTIVARKPAAAPPVTAAVDGL